ncbi:MAG: hypothetical protein RMH97_10120, partial [Verrucomicrobiales bacterium]|nr:hypothetical protein [Verrucomicrobiales bacterium]
MAWRLSVPSVYSEGAVAMLAARAPPFARREESVQLNDVRPVGAKLNHINLRCTKLVGEPFEQAALLRG